MSVHKPAKSRFWQYDFQYKGRRFHGSTNVETRRKAEEVERKLRHDAALGLLDSSANMTLDEGAGRWWLEVGQHLRTARDVERRLDNLLRLMGKDTRLTEISTRHVARAIERRRAETFTRGLDRPRRKAKAHPLSNATVNADVIGMLRRILSRAETVWEVKPIAKINWKALRLPEPAPEVRLYSPAQQEAWLAQCDPASRFALTLLLTYGLRLGELFFPLDAFDASGPRLSINKRKRGALLLPLRADDGREVAARIERAKAAGLETIWFDEKSRPARFGRPERVILTPRGYVCIQSRLVTAARRAGITLPRVIHGARHHAGTTMLSQSGNLRMTQQLLGHADITSTLRYAHALETDLRAALEGRASLQESEVSFPAVDPAQAATPVFRAPPVRRGRKTQTG